VNEGDFRVIRSLPLLRKRCIVISILFRMCMVRCYFFVQYSRQSRDRAAVLFAEWQMIQLLFLLVKKGRQTHVLTGTVV